MKQDDGKIVSYSGIYTSKASAISSAIATLKQKKAKKELKQISPPKSAHIPTRPLQIISTWQVWIHYVNSASVFMYHPLP